MSEKYLKIATGCDFSYIKIDSLDRLKKVDAIIFDCDGVLIDTRDSYWRSIIETIKFFFTSLTEIETPSDRVIKNTIHLLKKSGRYNNDWDVTYVILVVLFSQIPKNIQRRLILSIYSPHSNQNETLLERFNSIRTSMKMTPKKIPKNIDKKLSVVHRFTQKTDDCGVEAVEQELLTSNSKDIFLAIKHFLHYPGEAEDSLLITVFNELFYGPALFEKIHNRQSQFYQGPGFIEIEKEKTLLSKELLDEFVTVIGKDNFGIVSGRDLESAKFSLGQTLERFRKEALIFLLENHYPHKKPSPYPLIDASKGLAPFHYSLYIGDSAEDIMMVKRANAIDSRFLSVGVYSLSDFQDDLISYFLKTETDIITRSVSVLPSIIREIKVKSL